MANITIDEAARYLNVSTRTISNYISQGIITYHKKQGSNRKYIKAEELYELRESKASGDFSVKNFKKLQARVKKLEAQVTVLLKILDTTQIRLGIKEEEAVELFNAANTTLEGEFTIEHAEAWLPVLLSIDEFDLEVVQKATKADKPWYPFLSLCISLIVFVTGRREYNTSLDLQLLHKELAESRRRIRLSALLYLEQKGVKQEVDNLVTTRPETVVESLKKWAKSGHK